MTQRARVVLQDCRYAIGQHTDELGGEAFRVSWVVVVTLLRAVGHVLHKVDRLLSPSIREAVDRHWAQLQQSKPKPAIYWQFIEAERNDVVKLYEFGVDRWLEVDVHEPDRHTIVRVSQASLRGGWVTSHNGRQGTRLTRGPFAGRHERDVARDACQWWKVQLDEIDRASGVRFE